MSVRARYTTAAHAADDGPSAGVTTDSRPLIQRQAAASATTNGPGGRSGSAASRARYCVLYSTSQSPIAATEKTPKTATAVASTFNSRRVPALASRSSVPGAASAIANGKKAAIE